MSRDEEFEKRGEELVRRYEEEALFKEKNKEEFRVIEEVFDRLTLQGIYKLFKRGVIEDLYGVVKSGKEARVYYATNPQGEDLAVKIYYTHTAEFRKGMVQYIVGDPRFKRIRRNVRSLVYAWNQKEFNNLQLCQEAGVKVPKPIDFYRNILVMEFIGKGGTPAPLLKEAPPEDAQAFYQAILEDMRTMWTQAGLVHGDLSEYNIMNWENKPVIFDVSQAMLTNSDLAPSLLERDISNVNGFFSRLGVETRPHDELREWITGGTLDPY